MLVTKEPRRYRIECSNWPDFAAECSVELDIYHSSDCLHIHYYVDEPAVVANCGKDMEHVWEDSCVEFSLSLSITVCISMLNAIA